MAPEIDNGNENQPGRGNSARTPLYSYGSLGCGGYLPSSTKLFLVIIFNNLILLSWRKAIIRTARWQEAIARLQFTKLIVRFLFTILDDRSDEEKLSLGSSQSSEAGRDRWAISFPKRFPPGRGWWA